MSTSPELGVILPHFSDHCTYERLIEFAPRLEELGFHSVWVRDNLSYHGGHTFELPGNMFVDPFVTLSAIAARTHKLRLGTAVAIPFRNPVVTAQLVGSLSWVSRNRFEFGVGPGNSPKAFELTGIPLPERITLCREMVDVLRVLATDQPSSYRGEISRFDDVTIAPAPPADLRVWYGGASNVSIRRVLDYCDGILPGTCPFRRWDAARKRLAEGAAERGKKVFYGTIPLVSIGKTYEQAVAKVADRLPLVLEYLSARWKSEYASVSESAGAVIVGTADDFVSSLMEFGQHGLDLVVLDARLLMPEFEDALEEIGREVLPQLKKSQARVAGKGAE